MARSMHTVAPPGDKALLIGAPRKRTRETKVIGEHLDELARLVDTAGAEVVGRVIQAVEKPSNDTYIGRGKVEEVAAEVAELGATVVIFDDELSPTQGKNLEEALKVRVMDRNEVILDIFALRARSAEARTQVELAQLEYMLPRLARMWTHLSRIRGGMGMRGPGETQIETDRRMIRNKISQLKKKQADVAAHRERVRSRTRERNVKSVALVGYTNAGKSSLLRALTKAEAHVEDRLFATLDTQSREVVMGPGSWVLGLGENPYGRTQDPRPKTQDPAKLRFTDTVGFIRKLPHGLVASFRATLEEALDAALLLHVVDVSHNEWEDQASTVFEVLAEAGLPEDKPVIVVLNKADRLDPEESERRLREAEDRGWNAVLASTLSEAGIRDVKHRIHVGATPPSA